MRTATLLVSGIAAVSALKLSDLKPKAVEGRATIEAPVAPRMVFDTKDNGKAVAAISFSEADCKGEITSIEATKSGYVLYDYGSFKYAECRSDGVYYSAAGTKPDWDPTKEADYKTTTFLYKSGTTEFCMNGMQLLTCNYEGALETKEFSGSTSYVADKCSKKENLGTASFTNNMLCQNWYDGTFAIVGCAADELECFSDSKCATSKECPTLTTTTAEPYDAAKSCWMEDFYTDSEESAANGCYIATDNAIGSTDVKCNSYYGAIFVGKCGQYMPGAPNMNGAAAVAPALMVVASAVATVFLF